MEPRLGTSALTIIGGDIYSKVLIKFDQIHHCSLTNIYLSGRSTGVPV